ncbi:MAG: PPOX class F420-dependent oxidoreductase [Thermoleophilaceae bacterium]|nr:PPOX class F420-dependent oxidoreductase [Thermoleophilaceae bacterium]
MAMRLSDRISKPLVKAAKRPMNSTRSAKAFDVLEMPVQSTDFAALDKHNHALLVTYKRDGGAVPTPVWFGRDDNRVYVWTEVNAFKAKRLGRDGRALLAPCSPVGAPLGPPIAATGRVLNDEGERAQAAKVIHRSWGLGRRMFERMSRPVTAVHYLEFVPAATQR